MTSSFRTRGLPLQLCLFSAPLLSACMLFPPRLCAQAPVNASYAVASGRPITIDLKPREFIVVEVAITGGKYNELRIEAPDALSRGAFLKAVPVDSAAVFGADPYISDSGEPFLRIPAIPVQDVTARFQITALNNSKNDTRPVTATLALTGEEATSDVKLAVKAIRAFAHAERIRRDRGKAEDALPAYDDALAAARELKDRIMEQRVLLSKARFLDLDGRHYADAVQYAKQATEVDTGTLSPAVNALAWKTLGGAYLDMDRYAESIEASKHAADLFRQTGVTYWLGIVLENLGDAYLAAGNQEAALTTDTDALRIARELKDDYGIIEMLSEIGSIHKDRAEYQEALNDFSAAVELALPSSFNPMQAEAWTNLGELYTILGENDQALVAHRKALAIAQSTRNGIAELQALDRIGKLQQESGQRGEAESTFSHALARTVELQLTRQQSGLMADLARSEIKERKLSTAAIHAQQAIALAEQIHQPYEQADAWMVQAELAEVQGKRGDAEAALQQGNDLWRKLPDNARLAQGLTQLADLEIKSGKLEDAYRQLTQAIDIIESSRGSIARGGLRTHYFALQHHTYDVAVFAAMQLDRKYPGRGYTAKAWAIAERAKARSLLDSLDTENVEIGLSTDEPLHARLVALGREIEDAQDRIAQMGTSAADLDKAAKLQAALHQSLMEEQELESRLAATAVAKTPALSVLTPAAFAGSTLTPGMALLEYWVGERASYVWLIRQDGTMRVATLPDAERLKNLTDRYKKELLARNALIPNEDFVQRIKRVAAADARLDEAARLLGSVLLPQPIRVPLSSDRTLLIVPDGSLLSIPFTALIEPGARRYLAQQFLLISEPSAASIAAVAARPPREPGSVQRVAIFADPVYGKSDGRLQKEEASIAASAEGTKRGGSDLDLSHLPRLPGSRQEAMAIAAVAGPQNTSLHLGFDATPAAVKSLDWRDYSVAHFAAHAIAAVNVPETSGIVLSMVDRNGQSVDGMLWLRDIRRLHPAGDLVVLSGCATALGENIPGEGLNSLSRAFLESGTRDVTATLWSADDAMSSHLMESFYHNFINEHLSAPAALRAAQLQMLEDGRHRAPYYWAGFVMEGAWQAP